MLRKAIMDSKALGNKALQTNLFSTTPIKVNFPGFL
jgi:hypothetical protein